MNNVSSTPISHIDELSETQLEIESLSRKRNVYAVVLCLVFAICVACVMFSISSTMSGSLVIAVLSGIVSIATALAAVAIFISGKNLDDTIEALTINAALKNGVSVSDVREDSE